MTKDALSLFELHDEPCGCHGFVIVDPAPVGRHWWRYLCPAGRVSARWGPLGDAFHLATRGEAEAIIASTLADGERERAVVVGWHDAITSHLLTPG